MRRELKMLATDPPPGVAAWPEGDRLDLLRAQIQGPEDTPYSEGTFDLTLRVPARYPFEPPQVRFVTKVYHPNVDSGGRICLDTLKMPPKGAWVPSLNVLTLLSTIRVLLAEPNADDGLMPDITAQFRRDRGAFDDTARAWTLKYASSASRGSAVAPEERISSSSSTCEAAASSSVAAPPRTEPARAAAASAQSNCVGQKRKSVEAVASGGGGGDGGAAAAEEEEEEEESGSDGESESESSDFDGFGGNEAKRPRQT